MKNILHSAIYNYLISNTEFYNKLFNANTFGIYICIKFIDNNNILNKSLIYLGAWSRYYKELSDLEKNNYLNNYIYYIIDKLFEKDIMKINRFIKMEIYFMKLPLQKIYLHDGSFINKQKFNEGDYNVILNNGNDKAVYIKNIEIISSWDKLREKNQIFFNNKSTIYGFNSNLHDFKMINIINKIYFNEMKKYFIRNFIFDNKNYFKIKNNVSLENLIKINSIIDIYNLFKIEINDRCFKKIVKIINFYKKKIKVTNLLYYKDILPILLTLLYKVNNKINNNDNYDNCEFIQTISNFLYTNIYQYNNTLEICTILNICAPIKHFLIKTQKQRYKKLYEEANNNKFNIRKYNIEIKFLDSLKKKWKNTINIQQHMNLLYNQLCCIKIDETYSVSQLIVLFEIYTIFLQYNDILQLNKYKIYDSIALCFYLLHKTNINFELLDNDYLSKYVNCINNYINYN